MGSHKNRKSAYGGTFSTLPKERQDDYNKNKEIYKERRAKNGGTSNQTKRGGGTSETISGGTIKVTA